MPVVGFEPFTIGFLAKRLKQGAVLTPWQGYAYHELLTVVGGSIFNEAYASFTNKDFLPKMGVDRSAAKAARHCPSPATYLSNDL